MITIPTNMIINAEDALRIARAIRHDWQMGLATGFVVGFVVGVIFSIFAVMRIARSPLAKSLSPQLDETNWTCADCKALNSSGSLVCNYCNHPAPII